MGKAEVTGNELYVGERTIKRMPFPGNKRYKQQVTSIYTVR